MNVPVDGSKCLCIRNKRYAAVWQHGNMVAAAG
jgi:hypothetical protein